MIQNTTNTVTEEKSFCACVDHRPKVIIRRFLLALLMSAVLYSIACITIYLDQERLIFQSDVDPPDTHYHFDQPFEELWLSVDGAKIHMLWFRTINPKGVVVYLHGNGHSLRFWGREVLHFPIVVTMLSWPIIAGMVRAPAPSAAKHNYSPTLK